MRDSAKTVLYEIMNRRIFQNRELASQFREIFDTVFCVSERGRPRIRRSFLASYMVFSLIAGIWVICYPSRPLVVLSNLPILIGIGASVILVNPFGDYLSLWQTRFIVRYLESASRLRSVVLIIIDFVLTTGIFFLMAGVWIFFLFISTGAIGYTPGAYFYFFQLVCRFTSICRDLGMIMVDASAYNDILFILYCTTLFTSVWIWLLSSGVILWPLFKWINKVFEVEKHPLGTAMTIGASLITIPALIYGGLAITYFDS